MHYYWNLRWDAQEKLWRWNNEDIPGLKACFPVSIKAIASLDFSLSSFAMRKVHSSMASNVTDSTACLASLFFSPCFASFWVKCRKKRLSIFFLQLSAFFSESLLHIFCKTRHAMEWEMFEKFQKKVKIRKVFC